jgi:N-acetylneuraminic acid mutarotase
MPAVELNGLIYVPGGFGRRPDGLANGYGPVTSFDAYDPAMNSWKALAPMPEPRHHQMLAAYSGKLYVFGGFLDPWLTQSNAWVYDPATDHWKVLHPMPAPRTAGAAVALDHYIYLIGGSTSQAGTVLPTWRYDPSTDTWQDRAPLAQPREHDAAVTVDGKIFALGGRWTTTYASTEIYDPASDSWAAGPSMQFARAGFGATVLDGRVYVAGGELIDSLKTLNTIQQAARCSAGECEWSPLLDRRLRPLRRCDQLGACLCIPSMKTGKEPA